MIFKNKSGFTLIELMIIVVIIGILVAIAGPQYKGYVAKSKTVEAYEILDHLSKAQISYYNEYKEFSDAAAGGVANPVSLANTTVGVDSNWARLAYPAPVGARTRFVYRANAARYNGSGTLLTSAVTGSSMSNPGDPAMFGRFTPSAATCNTSYTFTAMGVSPSANYNWAFVSGTADLDSDQGTSCTAIGRLIVASPATNMNPNTQGYIVVNLGN